MPIVPAPVHYESSEFDFVWPETATVAAGCSQLQPAASYLVGELRRRCRLLETTVAERTSGAQSTVQLQIRDITEASGALTRDEAYELVIVAKGVTITAETPAGMFYGIQSLLQLLPWGNEASIRGPVLKGCRIVDYPRFKWRGVLLDTGRHIFSAEFIKKLLDLMALHKLNRFHWHLTEDQGWRIEIRALPLLTEIGAYRGDSKYGGFYTQDQIRDIVKYANERFIEVIPEIELPGHCMAALACYPELSCTGAVKEVPTQWGVQSDVYCAGKESTFQFLETVLDEVMELFPSKHIHIGGDECPKTRWAACDACQARIKSEGLSGEDQLQTYFINRVAQHLRKQGRCIIGWDEILEGGIPDEAVVMCWRGTIGGVEAAKHKHQVIMTPNTRCYFDYRQSASMQEPGTWYAVLPLEWVYLFDPCCRTGQLDMRLVYPQEQPQDQAAESMSPDDNETDSKTDLQYAADQVAIHQSSKKAVSDAEEAHQQSICSSLSEADALTDARLSSTQPTSTSFSTTPLNSTPTQTVSPLAEHAQEVASASVTAAAEGDSDIRQDSNQKLPESRRSMSAVDSGAEEDDSANAPTEEQMAARQEPLVQQEQEQWAQVNCIMDPEDQPYIIGGQANLWTEFISDEQTAEYMLLPRLCALAECVWSPVATRNWQSFIDRTHGFLAQLRTAGYNHRALQYRASGATNLPAGANTATA